jgi:hypothetical protein
MNRIPDRAKQEHAMRRSREPGEDDIEQLDLSSLDGDFATVSAASMRCPVPDGRYHVQVEQVQLTCSRTSQLPVLKWKLRILNPPFAGRCLFKNHALSSLDNLRWLKHDLHLCGLDLDKLSDLPFHLDRLFGIELQITKRTRGEWENVYFDHWLSPGSGAGPNTPPF